MNLVICCTDLLFLEGGDHNNQSSNKTLNFPFETSHGMEIAQLLLSLLHSWGLDSDLDRVCQAKLGLLRPLVSITLYYILVSHNYFKIKT